MGEYEPKDSRDVTLKPGTEAGGLERTGPREEKARQQAERGDDGKTPPRDHQPEQAVPQQGRIDQAQQHGVQLSAEKDESEKAKEDDEARRGYGGASKLREEKIKDDG